MRSKTYCNPLPLPDYPIGNWGLETDMNPHGQAADYREAADPTVIFYDGKWYLYVSCKMAYVSEDFVTWKYHDICYPGVEVKAPAGLQAYAPTVLHYKGKFYLATSCSELYVSYSPLGPFTSIGYMYTPSGEICKYCDVMLFADDDGRVYLYWCGSDGKYTCTMGAEMSQNDLTQMITEPKILFSFNPSHEWERFGAANQNKHYSWIEGQWMYKHKGRYYLTYCAPGTAFPNYLMGVYTSDRPLGQFTYAPINPITSSPGTLIRSAGHGCIVDGPNGTIWAFYTSICCYAHPLERRVGMDPVGFDKEGNMYVLPATDRPQLAPGTKTHPEEGNDAGWLPLCYGTWVKASSCAPGRDALYSADSNMQTFWQPAANDEAPWLSVDLQGVYKLKAVRIIWRDVNLNIKKGIVPGPYRYVVEASMDEENWFVLYDGSNNDVDMLIDYKEFSESDASYVRLRICGVPNGMIPGVIDFQVFGYMED